MKSFNNLSCNIDYALNRLYPFKGEAVAKARAWLQAREEKPGAQIAIKGPILIDYWAQGSLKGKVMGNRTAGRVRPSTYLR